MYYTFLTSKETVRKSGLFLFGAPAGTRTPDTLLSIIENAGLMGVPIPKVPENAIELLRRDNE